MMMTAAHADKLAAFLCTLRPEWSKHYVVDALLRAQVISTDVERVTRVAVRAALTPKIRKPDVIGMNGEHWKAQADFEPEPAVGVARCDSCRGIHTATSPCDERPSERPDDWLVQLRREVRKTKRYGADA